MSERLHACGCTQPATTPPEAGSTRRALPALAIAALVPKCPACLFGWCALAGATSPSARLLFPLGTPLLFGVTLAALAIASTWLVLTRGLIGGLVGGVAAALVVVGKLIFPCAGLVVCGVFLFAGYVLLAPPLAGFFQRRSA